MASPFNDLELLMDHNTNLAAASASLPPRLLSSTLPSLETDSLAPLSAQQEQVQHSTLQEQHRPSHHHLTFATLSLAFGPVISPSFLPNPKPNPNLNLGSRPSAKAAIAFPSQKKCISPTPFMPAITAASVATDIPLSRLASGARKNSTAFPDYQRLPERNNNFRDPSNGAAMRRASIVWFRNDLRCHDNEALAAASKESLSVLPVYCFDPRDYGKSSSGFDKTGPYRAKFLLECVSVLRENLRERGSDLVVRVGKPEEVLVTLAKSIGADALYAHQEVSCEEVQCEKKVSAALQEEGVDVKYFWGSTLFHVDDLPFKLEDMPITYSGFREKVQNIAVRQALEAPKQLKGLPARGGVKPGDIPMLQELGLRSVTAQRQDGQTVVTSALVGGEVEALQRLKSFAVDHIKKSTSKTASGGCGESLYGSNFSCKISPWLAMGCLSPRRMFEDLRSNGKSAVSASASASTASVANDNGLNWLVFELLWRDFFRFITKKYAASKRGSEVVTASPSTVAVPV